MDILRICVRVFLYCCCVSALVSCVSSQVNNLKQDEVRWDGKWGRSSVPLFKPDGSTNELQVLRAKLIWLSNGWRCPYEVTVVTNTEGRCVWLGHTSDAMIESQNEMYALRVQISTLQLTGTIHIPDLHQMRIEDLSRYLNSKPSGMPIYDALHGKFRRDIDLRTGVHWGFFGITPGNSRGGDPHMRRLIVKGDQLELQLDSPGGHLQAELLINLRSNRVISATGTGASTNKLFGPFD